MLYDAEIMTAQTALNTVSTEVGRVEAGNINEITFYLVAAGVIATGAIQVEEAHVSGYAGTWAPVGSPITLVTDSVKTVKATGVGRVYRARISTGLTGGGNTSVFVIGR
jgi:hypothetical protein